jgi:hypothetical protein
LSKANNDHSNELAQEWIKYNTNFFGQNLFKTVRNNETEVGIENYPAWGVDSMNKFADGSYDSTIYSVFNNKIYEIDANIASLAVPEYLPIIQQMIDTFHITQAVNTTQSEISPELDCDQNPDAEVCVQEDSPTTGEENEDEDDQPTDEENNNDLDEDEEN